jgi:hypothetical protein
MNHVPETLALHERDYYTYKCRVCGFECRKKLIPGNSVPVTRKGDYGSEATPTPVEFADEMYEATSIAFVAAAGTTPANLTDSLYRFGDKHFSDGMTIRIETTSTTNDGDYTIADRGVTRGQILLSSTDSLTDEDASTAGTVTISRIIYKPNVPSGCPLCGSLRGQ